mmetsp:Transcript_28212/g.56333  ORF Transcript_28212/g.56333 Transcript_28212/m.56333 type:complete len:531 (-) Transcript_28212:187-1779(-)
MGANASKHPLTNTPPEMEFEQPPTSHPESRSSSRGTPRGLFVSCPTLFCPPRDGSSPSSSRHGNRSRHGDAISNHSSREDDSFGTPIPDTPDPVRRIRNAAKKRSEGYNHHGDDDEDDFGEEKKIAGGSFGRCGNSGRNGEMRSSRYSGLEKEESGMFSYENRNQFGAGTGRMNGNNGSDNMDCAEIHEGKNAENELYAKYTLLEVLGVGSTSTCHRCIEISTQESRACKIIDKTEIDPKYQSMMDQFYMEIQTLRTLQHPNIIRLFDVYITKEKIYIIMELMEGGELFDYVVQKGTLTEEEASRIVRKVTSALVYMHSKNVIHRDLKPENLLLAHKPRSSHDIEVKIIDFGLSKIMSDGPVASSFLGTRGYLAPEMIQRRQYTKSVDAWALGVIVFVLLCSCLPFDDDCQSIPNSPDLRTKFTLRFPRWAKDLSRSAKDLLNHLLDIDSRRRYTAEQALEHPWVRGDTASKDSLLQSPGRIKPSPGGGGRGQSSQATKDHVSQMVANRAIANAQLARNSPKMHVRKTSI